MSPAQLKSVISGLLEACNEFMTEFVSKKRAARWDVINEAMVAGSRAVKELAARPQDLRDQAQRDHARAVADHHEKGGAP